MCIKSLLTNGLIVTIFGVFFTSFMAIFGWIGVPQIIKDVSIKTAVFEEDNFVWKTWQDPPYPIYTDFYVFNCTNYDEVLAGTADKPIVKELGPYSYREYRYKFIQNGDNLTNDFSVFYRENRTYYFSRETTPEELDLNDVIYTVNPVFTTLSKFLEALPSGVPYNQIINLIETNLRNANESVFMRVTVDQFVFKGWPLKPYIDLYNTVQNQFPILGLPDLGDLNLPFNITQDLEIGLFTTRNNTNDGLFQVNRGLENYKDFGQILSWGKELNTSSDYLPYWEGGESYCNKIRGCDGTVFPAYGLNVSERLYVYQTDLCRAVYASYVHDENYRDILARKFTIPREVLANYKENPENVCFCRDLSETPDEARCPKTGALSVGACYADAPIVGSNPHFFEADENYISGVEGLNPNQSLHQTFFLLEARTNVLLKASKRVMLSFALSKTRLSATNNLKSVFLPMMWYEETATIDDETYNKFQIFTTVDIVLWVFLSVGIVLTLVGLGLISYHFYLENKKSLAEKVA